MNNVKRQTKFEQISLANDKQQYRRSNTALLFFHTLLAIPCIIISPVYMTILYVWGACFYVIGFAIINKSKRSLLPYSYMILVQLMIHVFFSVLILGWKCGFQYWIFALACTYLKNYLRPSISKKFREVYSRTILTLAIFAFIVTYLFSKYIDFPYISYPSHGWTSVLMIFNAILTFSAIGAFTRIYTRQMEFKYSELYNKADFDALTGLGNRYYLKEILASEENYCHDNTGYSVAMLDIDYFKKVNDTYGHDNGDIVLRDIAAILSDSLPSGIEVGRWGGEEFLFISSHEVHYEDFIKFVETIREKISQHPFILGNEKTIRCTISAGAATYKKDLKMRDILKKADDQLYIAKSSGRNTVIA